MQGEEYHGLTAMHLAIAYGNDEIAEVLVHCGVDINVRQDHGIKTTAVTAVTENKKHIWF